MREDIVKRRKKNKEYIDSRKRIPCADCNGVFPEVCMDFHHINPNEKDQHYNNGQLKCWSMKRIVEELDKCVVLCANCHRIRHYH